MPSVPLADPQVDLLGQRAGDDFALLGAGVHRHRVEKRLGLRRKAELAQARRQHGGAAMHRAGDVGQPLRAVIDRIHRGDHRQQHLRGADVGGRLFAADMLLAGLQREAIGRLPRESIDSPTMRPGSERFSASRTAI